MSRNVWETAMDTMIRHPTAAIAMISSATLFAFACLSRKSSKLDFQGPPSPSWISGVAAVIAPSKNPSPIYVAWSKVYGAVFKIPAVWGAEALVILDPKALATLFARDTSVYHQGFGTQVFLRRLLGEVVLITDGEDHKRHRRALSFGFSVAAIKKLTPVFLENTHHVCDRWKEMIYENGGSSSVIEVQHWMNAIALDNIGIGGFSHDFGATKGEQPSLQQRFEALSNLPSSFTQTTMFILLNISSVFARIPTKRNRLLEELSESIRQVAVKLYEKRRAEKHGFEDNGLAKSIIGALLKSEIANPNLHMEVDEIMAQIGMFMLAGYEPVATVITWCLIELCLHHDVQRKLRDEIAGLGGQDPTYEQLSSGLPHLDAVVCETLRLHAPFPDIFREAVQDDVLPLTSPVFNAKGESMDSLPIAAGTSIRIPLGAVNIHGDFWGEDSEVFNPSRWIDDGTSREKSKQISGFRHMLTFGDGPRMCIGRLFALTGIKAALVGLLRDFSFEFPEGKDTKVSLHRSLNPRPKVEGLGQEGPYVPMVVRKL